MGDNEIGQIRQAPMRMAAPPRVEFRSSTAAWLFRSGSGWVVLLVLLAVFGTGAWFGYWWQSLAGIALIGLPSLIYTYLRFRTATFALDGERLFMCRGIFMRTDEEIELYRVKDTKVSFSVIQQMFDNGTIMIASSDASGTLAGQMSSGARTTITVPYVVGARRIREEIRHRVEAARQRRGVREFDMN